MPLISNVSQQPMTDDLDPRPSEQTDRVRWFDRYVLALKNSVLKQRKPGTAHACPCCRFLTLGERGGFEICPVCFWEDDGQDDKDASVVRGGPNGALSLEQARCNFAAFGACDERSKGSVRAPRKREVPNAG